MQQQSIKEKIRKLLAIVECESATPAEQESALHQASKLSQKYAIDLDAIGSEASDYDKSPLDAFARTPSWADPVGIVLQEHFNVKILVVKHATMPGITVYYAFGCKPARDVAEYIWTYLSREFQRLHKKAGIKRNSVGFYRSLSAGLIDAITLQTKKEGLPQQPAMILANKLQEAFDEQNSGIRCKKNKKVEADRAAYAMGHNITINQALRDASPQHKKLN